jgi:hypothetical protein
MTDPSIIFHHGDATAMAKKRRRNKSQAIRDFLSTSPQSTPSEIVAALAEKGIRVTSSLASNVKYTSSNTRRRKGAKKSVRRRIVRRGAAGALSADDIMAAKELADQLGGIAEARRALETLEALV